MDLDFLTAAPQPDLLDSGVATASYNKTASTAAGQRGKLLLRSAAHLPPLRLSIPPEALTAAAVRARVRCASCGAKRSLFCYTCRVVMPPAAPFVPLMTKLPVKIDVLKDRGELDSKVRRRASQ